MTVRGKRRDRRPRPVDWESIRRRVWNRDGCHCQVCGTLVPRSGWIAGHKVDHIMGGADTTDNLAVMCTDCDRAKPFHATVEEYETWVADGGILGSLDRAVAHLAAELARSSRGVA